MIRSTGTEFFHIGGRGWVVEGELFFAGTSYDRFYQLLPSLQLALLSASPCSGVLRTPFEVQVRESLMHTICQSTEDRAFREFTWLWKQSFGSGS